MVRIPAGWRWYGVGMAEALRQPSKRSLLIGRDQKQGIEGEAAVDKAHRESGLFGQPWN